MSEPSLERSTLFRVSPAGLDSNAALAAARLLLPLLARGPAPWPVDQLTLYGAEAVLILTPLAVMNGAGSVLLSVVPPDSTVASAERLALRAVAADPSDETTRSASISDEPEEWQEPDLLDSEPSTRVHQIGASLQAFESVVAGVLRDVEAARDLFLFLPAGSNVRMTGRFASEIDHAMRMVATSRHTFHTAVLRCGGRRRLFIRVEQAATGRATIVVAGGATERPGLARRQVEAAALALQAR